MRFLLFLILESWLVPLQVLAVALFMGKLKKVTAAGVTGTAHKPLDVRLIMHAAQTRPDPAAEALARQLPHYGPFITWAFGSFGLASRIAGFEWAWTRFPPELPSTLYSFINHRTHFLERHLLSAVRAKGEGRCQQVVILGAGWDTRAWGMLADTDTRVFEIDTPASQAVKRAAAEAAGLSKDKVTFVATDFTTKTWLEALDEAGFDRSLPTFFLLEGLVYYLSDEDLGATLRDIAGLAPGSRAAFDYLALELIEGKPPFEKLHERLLGKAKKTYPNEPFESGIPTRPHYREPLEGFLRDHGLEPTALEPFGPEGDAFGGLAAAMVPAAPRSE